MERAEIVAARGVATSGSGGVETVTECRWCRKPLTDDQRRRRAAFCCAACRVAEYDQRHPRIAPPGLGLRRAGTIKQRIVDVLADGVGRTTAQLAYELRESEATTARELRKVRAAGLRVRVARPRGHRAPAVYSAEVQGREAPAQARQCSS